MISITDGINLWLGQALAAVIVLGFVFFTVATYIMFHVFILNPYRKWRKRK